MAQFIIDKKGGSPILLLLVVTCITDILFIIVLFFISIGIKPNQGIWGTKDGYGEKLEVIWNCGHVHTILIPSSVDMVLKFFDLTTISICSQVSAFLMGLDQFVRATIFHLFHHRGGISLHLFPGSLHCITQGGLELGILVFAAHFLAASSRPRYHPQL